MATPKKKHLIELMLEAGVKWPESAEYAAQDKCDNKVYFFNSKPKVYAGETHYCAPLGPVGNPRLLPSLCRNWHQTIVTREQYAEAVAANVGSPAVMQSKSNQVRKSDDVPAVDSVEWHNPPSIEHLTADYHAKAAEADRLQAVADEALKAADDALLALEKAGELIGLVISIDTKPKHVEQPTEPEQPVITDWRDLRVGDVVWWEGDAKIESGEYTVERVEPADYTGDCTIFLSAKEWVDVSEEEWRFIRRP